jgi:hypothetical protein
MKRLRAWLYGYYYFVAKPYLKPTIIVSFGIAWFLTNGWSYLFLIIGSPTMRKVALSYIAFLWLPISPEKIVTIPLALFIQKKIFNKGVGHENTYKAKKCKRVE